MTAFSMLAAKDAFGSFGQSALHHPARAKRMIFLFMGGGPSQVDTFDPKPALLDWQGKELTVPNARNAGYPFALPSAYKFAKHGESGIEISELFSEVATCADDLCVIRSMCCDDNNHPGGTRQMMTGFNRARRPSFGAWLHYGLGTENENLPGYVVMGDATRIGSNSWSSNFLPANNQGTPIRVGKDPIRNSKPGLPPNDQRNQLDLIAAMNRRHSETALNDDRLEARIEAAELAFLMQSEAPEATDITKESEATQKLYGVDSSNAEQRLFASQLLGARRLLERGVRVVQVHQHGREWDHHGQLKSKLKASAYAVDKPIAGLLKDLKSRGLLDDTLVLWGGEFGRTPTSQGPDMDSRAHYPTAFTMWMAGGGVKAGHVHGRTDEFGCNIEEGRMHVHDLHATILHLMGLDHERLTFSYGGREQTLTDVHGEVVTDLLA